MMMPSQPQYTAGDMQLNVVGQYRKESQSYNFLMLVLFHIMLAMGVLLIISEVLIGLSSLVSFYSFSEFFWGEMWTLFMLISTVLCTAQAVYGIRTFYNARL